jgi:catechol 2,3-dioxygenase-like lactoylglutathione lyase family enzyme
MGLTIGRMKRMQTHFGHMQINVGSGNLAFYQDLLAFLGWKTLYQDDSMLGAADKHGVSLWFAVAANGASNDYDGAGVNHLAFSTATQADVDSTAEYLQQRGVELLYETPRHRAEFSGENSTYYQVMFETPDRILIEVVYTGPRQA